MPIQNLIFKMVVLKKSAILTTNSIDMAKRYYQAIEEMTKDPEWLTKEFAGHPIRTGRTIEDPDFHGCYHLFDTRKRGKC